MTFKVTVISRRPQYLFLSSMCYWWPVSLIDHITSLSFSHNLWLPDLTVVITRGSETFLLRDDSEVISDMYWWVLVSLILYSHEETFFLIVSMVCLTKGPSWCKKKNKKILWLSRHKYEVRQVSLLDTYWFVWVVTLTRKGVVHVKVMSCLTDLYRLDVSLIGLVTQV